MDLPPLGDYTQKAFDEFVRALARENDLSLETAEHYASLIGDCITLASEGGNIAIVTDENGNEIARVKLPKC